MLTVADIMTQPVVSIRGAETVERAVALMKQHAVSSLLVDRRHPQDAYGIVTVTDVVWKIIAYGKDPKQVRVYEIMTKPCIVLNPDLGAEYAARLFAEAGIRSAPVIQGDRVGIVSVTDLLLKTQFVEQPQGTLLEEKLQAAIEQARTTCAGKGFSSADCMRSWQVVEDLQAELAHQRADKTEKTAYDRYLASHPVMAEEDYEVLSQGYMGL